MIHNPRARVVSVLVVLAMSIAGLPVLAQDEVEKVHRSLIDYATLDHWVAVDSFRAGNHDDSGVNDYYFEIHFSGVVNTPDERLKKPEERRRVTVPGGEFHPLTLESLKFWKPDEKVRESGRFQVKGDLIREIVAKTMLEYSVPEEGVAVFADITLYEKAKQFYFFGEDYKVSRTRYYPIPATGFDSPPRTNLSLTLSDDKGTLVLLSVEYATPSASARKDEAKGE